MVSNTKLNAKTKSILKDMKIEAKNMGITVVNNGETTFAYQLKGNTVKFSTSVSSPDENKFRRKVGEYLAIERLMWDNKCVVMNVIDFESMLESIFCIEA